MRYHHLIITALALSVCASAQDPAERVYNYEVLTPQKNVANIQAKPKVEGWAAARIREKLGRGTVAVRTDKGVYVGWRMLEADSSDIAFDIYRRAPGGRFRKVNASPVTRTTDYLDTKAPKGELEYQVRMAGDINEPDIAETVPVLGQNYISIKFQGNYFCQKAGVGDLDGDGRYDYVIKQPFQRADPGVWARSEETFKLEAYNHDGEFLWRHDLGWNIEQGVWYSPYVVADLDGDGRAEIAVKTAPVDKDYRDKAGRVVGAVPKTYEDGKPGTSPYGICPEYLSILDPGTGEELARTLWIPQDRGFGDYNRNNRNQLAIAYLDGKTPCVIMMRGTYRKMAARAYQYHDGRLELLWEWCGDEESPVIRSQGAHQTVCADVDMDGRDEVILGSAVLDDNGQALWSAGVGHSDKAIVGEIDPDNEGLEILYANEVSHEKRGVCLVSAATGQELWNIGHFTGHIGNGMAADLDPDIPGLECIAHEDSHKSSVKEGPTKFMFDCKGKLIGTNESVPQCTNWIWWDADNLREQPEWIRPSHGESGRRRSFGFNLLKYGSQDPVTKDFQGAILMIADILGDWREEIVTVVEGELRIYTTTIPASGKRSCLMQDPLYRSYIYNRTMGYDQSPMTSYFLE